MFPNATVDRDGIMVGKYAQPLMFRLAFVASNGKWHAFTIADVVGTISRKDFNEKHGANLSAADIESLKDNARRSRDANGDMNRQLVDRRRPLDETHARLYIHYIEPGLGAPTNAAPYETMLHEAMNEDKRSKQQKEMAPDGEYGTRVMQALKPGVFGLLASLRTYTETIIGILMCTLILIMSELAVHAGAGNWQNVLTGGVATSLVSNAVGCMFKTMLGVGLSDLGKWSGASLGAWAREWLERYCPWYAWAIRSVGTTQDILRCLIRILLPWAIPVAMGWIALLTPVAAVTAAAAGAAGVIPVAVVGMPLYDALSTAIQQAIDEVTGVKYMSTEWQKRCSNIEMLRRILSSIGGLFERERTTKSADELAAETKAQEAAKAKEAELKATLEAARLERDAAAAAEAAKIERERIEDETRKLGAQFQGAYDKSKADEEQAERNAVEKKRLDDERKRLEDEAAAAADQAEYAARRADDAAKAKTEAAAAQKLADEAAAKAAAEKEKAAAEREKAAAEREKAAAEKQKEDKVAAEKKRPADVPFLSMFDTASKLGYSVTPYCDDYGTCRDAFVEKGWFGRERIVDWTPDYYDPVKFAEAQRLRQVLKKKYGRSETLSDSVTLDSFDLTQGPRRSVASIRGKSKMSEWTARLRFGFGETTGAKSGIFDAAIGLVKSILALDATKELDFSLATLQTSLVRNLGTASGMVHVYTTLSTVLAKLGVKVPAHSSLPSYVVSWTGLCMLAAMQVAFAPDSRDRDGRSLASFFRTLATVGMHHFAPSATKLLQCQIAVEVAVSPEMSAILKSDAWLGPTIAKTLSDLVRSGVLDAKPTVDGALGVLRDPVMVSVMLRMQDLSGSGGAVDQKLVLLRDFCQNPDNADLGALLGAARAAAEAKNGDAMAYLFGTLRASDAAAPSDVQRRALESVKAHAALVYLRSRSGTQKQEIPSTAAGWLGLALEQGVADLSIRLNTDQITKDNWRQFVQDPAEMAQKAAMRAAGDFAKAARGKSVVRSERVVELDANQKTTLTPEFKGRLTELLIRKLGSKVDLTEFLGALGAHIADPTSQASKAAFLASLGKIATSKIDVDNVTDALSTLHDAYKHERSVSIFSQKVIASSVGEMDTEAQKASASAQRASAAAATKASAEAASAAAAATKASASASAVGTAKERAEASSRLLEQQEKDTQGGRFARDALERAAQSTTKDADVGKAAEILRELGLSPTKRAETAKKIHLGINGTDGFATDTGKHTGDTFTSASEAANVGHVVRVADDGTVTVHKRDPGYIYGSNRSEVRLSDSVKRALAQALTGRSFDSAFVRAAAATHTERAREAATSDASAYHSAVSNAGRDGQASAEATARAKRSEKDTKARLTEANDAKRALERQRAVRTSVDAFDKELESDFKEPSLARDSFVARAAQYAGDTVSGAAQYASDAVSGALSVVRTGATAEAFAQKTYLQQQAQKQPALAKESAAEFNRAGGARYAAIDDINRRAQAEGVRVPHWSRIAPDVIGSRAAVDLRESAKAIRPLALDVREVPADAIYTDVKRALVVGPWSGRHAKRGGIWVPSAYQKMQVAVLSAESQEPAFISELVAALRERGTPPPYDAVVVTAPEVAHALELGRMMRELLLEGGVALVAYEAHCAPKPIDGGLLYAGSFSVGESGDVYCAMSRVVGVWGDKKLCRRSSTRSERDVQLLTCARRFVAAASIELAVDKLVLGL